MKAFFKAAFFLIFLVSAIPLNSYFVTYKEQYYRLYHIHYNQYPDDTMENIYWLEQALKAEFANPLYALAHIETEIQWEKYRYLFNMHINLKIIEQYIYLGNKYNKRNAYFYNAPWKDQILECLEIAESCFRTALYYWDDAVSWAEKANERRFRWINLEKVQFWQDEAYRIENNRLDYKRVLNRELASIQRVREQFENMENHYYIRDTSE